MSPSTNAGEGRGPASAFSSAGVGGTRPVISSHRVTAAAYRPQRRRAVTSRLLVEFLDTVRDQLIGIMPR